MIENAVPKSHPSALRKAFISVRQLKGRLLGVRVGELRSPDDWALLDQAVRDVVDETQIGRVVICTDLRQLPFLPEVPDDAIPMGIARRCPLLLREAIVVPETPLRTRIANLLERTAHRARLVSSHPDEAVAWLSPCLGMTEIGALRAFLSSPAASAWATDQPSPA
jgi:hypothetical protein